MASPLVVDARRARRLLLHLQGLGDDPRRRPGPEELSALIERMGFVQLDSILTVERAHHLTLFSRHRGYRRADLDLLFAEQRRLFEHWTHDASLIPIHRYGHWRRRFARMAEGLRRDAWFAERIGPDAGRTVAAVLAHVRASGETLARDLADDGERGRSQPWWGWRPAKAALEYLWRSGRLAVARRENFQKVYDLAERVIPERHRLAWPDDEAHRQWACASALDRLGIATAGEIAAFWEAVPVAEARAWTAAAARAGRVQEVLVAAADGGRQRPAFAWADLEDRLDRLRAPPAGLRFLSPFDPVLRDRRRALRLFAFDYRFEAFVPARQRRWGHYVLPMLQGDRPVGRAAMKFHRREGVLAVEGLWWEKGLKAGPARLRALAGALERLRRFLGAERVAGGPR